MAQSQNQEQGSDKNAYYIIWLLILVFIVGAIVWYLFQVELKLFFIYVRIYEITAIHFFFGLIPSDFPWIGETCDQLYNQVGVDLAAARQLTPENVNMEIAGVLSEAAGQYLRYPIGILLFCLGILVFRFNVHLRLRKKFNMHTLSLQERVNWPQIKIVTELDLVNEDLDSGPWAMAMSPVQFARKNRLVTVEMAAASQSPFSKIQAPEFVVTVDKVRAERAFSVQLGRTWHGCEAMLPYRRAIFAIFAARGTRDTKAANALVVQLATSAANGQVDCKGADELWKKHIKEKRVQEICAAHAYEFTVFISLLQFAREDGVVPSSDFLWIKPLDRRLWYVINNVGRQTPCVEVAGIFSHWYYEMALKRPLSVPRVDSAVHALQIALTEVIYIPDEKEKMEILKRQENNQEAEHNAEQTEKGTV